MMMKETPRNIAQRLVRVPLSVDLIRRIDDLVGGSTSAFADRTEFIREALEAYVIEQEFAADDQEVQRPLVGDEGPADGPQGAETELPTLGDTRLLMPLRESAVLEGGFCSPREPLLGLHNRDYPTLWAFSRLATWCADGPLSFSEFADRVTEAAWLYAEDLELIGAAEGIRLTALFPSNPKKPAAAESIWRNFALGRLQQDGSDVRGDGPLFQWELCGVQEKSGRLELAPTGCGLELLSGLRGLTIASPHPEEPAKLFLEYIRSRVPADWWGFERALELIADEPNRQSYESGFVRALSDWSETKSRSAAAGYLARCREWGLVEQKMTDGRYRLTNRASGWMERS